MGAFSAEPQSAAGTAAGRYELTGVREVGSELLLRPDGRFEYYLAYGAADFMASGKWHAQGGAIVLDTEMPAKAQEPIELIASSGDGKGGEIQILLQGPAPERRRVANIDLNVRTKADGKFHSGRTDSEGIAHFERSIGAVDGVVFEVRVYNYRSKLIALDPAKAVHTFEIHGDVLMRVPFQAERLTVDKDNGDLLMSYWAKGESMRYVKRK